MNGLTKTLAVDQTEILSRFLIVDDHKFILEPLSSLLSTIVPNATVRLATNCDEAESYSGKEQFDLILLDMNLPGITGMEGLKRIRAAFPSSKVVILSAEESPAVMRQAYECGAIGYIPKSTSPRLLDGVFRLVATGTMYLPPQMVSMGVEASPSPGQTQVPEPFADVLTDRQRQVLRWLAQGKQNKEIAIAMHISLGAVKNHVQGILSALGVKSRNEAIAILGRLNRDRDEAVRQPPIHRASQ